MLEAIKNIFKIRFFKANSKCYVTSSFFPMCVGRGKSQEIGKAFAFLREKILKVLTIA